MITNTFLRRASMLGGLSIVAFNLAACATVTRGTHEDWVVQSDPAGATVVTSNGFACDATPCTLKVPRKPGFDVTVSKKGYKTVKTTVTSAMSSGGGGALAGNILVGGIIGGVVDANNGSLNDITPNPLVVKLEKDDAPAIPTTADQNTAAAQPATPQTEEKKTDAPK